MLNNKKRARMRGSGVVTSSSATAAAAEIAKCAQAPREKLKNRPPDNIAMMTRLESRMPRVITPISSKQQREDQERSVDVRVLERRADAVIAQKYVGARKQMEKADIARRRGDQCGEDIGAAQDRQPHQIAVAEQAGEHDRRKRQIERRGDILDRFAAGRRPGSATDSRRPARSSAAPPAGRVCDRTARGRRRR